MLIDKKLVCGGYESIVNMLSQDDIRSMLKIFYKAVEIEIDCMRGIVAKSASRLTVTTSTIRNDRLMLMFLRSNFKPKLNLERGARATIGCQFSLSLIAIASQFP